LVDGIDRINVQAPAALAASTTALSITPSSVSGNELVEVTTTITGLAIPERRQQGSSTITTTAF
jgi:hypothetical protein